MVSLPQCTVPEEGIVHTECHTEAYTNERSCGSGTLYITESHVRWINSEGNGFKLDYPSISIHAISRDTTTFPHECLYMILDVKLDADGDPADEGDESDSDSGGTEVRFVPAEKQNLDAMYQAMCACQELHPDLTRTTLIMISMVKSVC
ncbi:CLNS1A [Bugula neritina]|uniref:Methylosome subunit pICln n=1 Tax=Bugula neritina TaxID=10212 RepID=A0A7J7J1I7_BUGNE|nr:CLNS1A [Bugula neritina]